MKNLTKEQIENFKKLAKLKTSKEVFKKNWDPSDCCDGSFYGCYNLAQEDAQIENARFILDLLEIE